MKTITTLLLVLLLCVFTSFAQAQEADSIKTDSFVPYKWRAGLGAGFTSGLGISVKYQPKNFGTQLNFLPYFDDYGSRYFVSVGLTLSQDLWHNKNSAIHIYLANSFTSQTSGFYRTSTTSAFNTGVGFGLEQIGFDDRVIVGIMAGYAQYDSFKQMFLTAEFAVHYLFAKK